MTMPGEKFEYKYPESVSIRSYNPPAKGHSGQIKKAVNSLEKVVALRPNSAPACNTLAMLYLEQDYCLDDALILAKKAVKLKPIASYWDTLAYSLYKKQNYKEADEAIKKALELQPGYPEYLARQQAVRKHLTK